MLPSGCEGLALASRREGLEMVRPQSAVRPSDTLQGRKGSLGGTAQGKTQKASCVDKATVCPPVKQAKAGVPVPCRTGTVQWLFPYLVPKAQISGEEGLTR